MNTVTYENTNIDSHVHLNPLIIGEVDISSESDNKKRVRLQAKQKYITRQKLDLINEQKSLDRQLNSFSDYWDM